MPGYPLAGEGPIKERSIARAGIEQAVGSDAEHAWPEELSNGRPSAHQQPCQACGHQRTDGDEHQCVREVPVELDEEQRVGWPANQYICIGQQPSNCPRQCRYSHTIPTGPALCGCSTDHSLRVD